ncbi:MAG: N-acetylmuramic acid 6-phosphate etherase [Prevotella sp.]|nr:N-acetylmuramic acid 6-phosphate etherase [Prevotella sp.]
MSMMEEKRITEQPSAYRHLERMTVGELIADINRENESVPRAVHRVLPDIERLITAVEEKVRMGGRLFYCGCGTGGRLCALDTVEVSNTYGTDRSMIQAIFPGGLRQLLCPEESHEDNTDEGWQQLLARGISERDVVIGFSASGTTPFVRSTLARCREAGIMTGSVCNNPGSPISALADYPVEVVTGPEFVTGSTRMKGGTSQKLILDMISTTLMIRLGRVEDNLMVNARLLNDKLIDRAVRIFRHRNPQYTDYDAIRRLILKAGSVRRAEELVGSSGGEAVL